MSAHPSKPASSFYSYSAKRSLRQEEIAAYKRIALATVLIVALLVGGYFVGIPLIGQIGSSTSIVSHNPLGTADNIPPTSPHIDGQADTSRVRTIDVTGSAEGGSTVSISVNTRPQASVLADKNGAFRAQITLSNGQNSITATAKDAVGNQSRVSSALLITYSAAPPKLLITSPDSDELTVAVSKVTVSGTTAAEATITINDRQVIVQPDGSFTSQYSLSDGLNTLTIISTDAAGNTTKVVRSVTYTNPQASAAATPSQ